MCREINKVKSIPQTRLFLRDRCLARFSIYLSIYLSYSRPFRSDRSSLSLPQATAETNSRNSVRRSPSGRYLKPSNEHSMNELHQPQNNIDIIRAKIQIQFFSFI